LFNFTVGAKTIFTVILKNVNVGLQITLICIFELVEAFETERRPTTSAKRDQFHYKKILSLLLIVDNFTNEISLNDRVFTFSVWLVYGAKSLELGVEHEILVLGTQAERNRSLTGVERVHQVHLIGSQLKVEDVDVLLDPLSVR
jgi:hypothetical protein